MAALAIAEYEQDFPDDILVVYRNQHPLEHWPTGFECLIAIPKKKLRELRAAGEDLPLVVHGATIHVGPPREGEDAGVSPSP